MPLCIKLLLLGALMLLDELEVRGTGLSYSEPEDRKMDSIKELLAEEPEIADFYRFVAENDLRQQALEALERRLGSSR